MGRDHEAPRLKLRLFRIPDLPLTVMEVREEIDTMTEVLMGRVLPPIDQGVMTLQEVADAYYARCAEITIDIQRLEADGLISKGAALYKVRTGELRTFMELCKRASDLGSRRLTHEKLLFEAKHDHDVMQ